MAGEAKDPGVQAHLVSKIVASYVAHHTVPPEQIPVLIGTIHRTFSQLGRPAEQPARAQRRGISAPLEPGERPSADRADVFAAALDPGQGAGARPQPGGRRSRPGAAARPPAQDPVARATAAAARPR